MVCTMVEIDPAVGTDPGSSDQQQEFESDFHQSGSAKPRLLNGYEFNAFKIEFARRAIVRALSQAAAGTPQSQTDKRIH